MAKALTAKDLKALRSGEVVKLAERMKIAGFTKMNRDEMETAILDAQKAGGKAISTDDLPKKDDRKERRDEKDAKPEDPRKPKPRTARDADEVDLVYVGKGGSVTIGKTKYTPGLGVRMTRIEARVIRNHFPQRFRINEVN